jgi:hypothetical protein
VPTEVGIAVADAVAVIGAGIEAAAAGWQAPPPQLKRQAGEHLGRVAMLQLEHQGSDADFAVLVRSEGKRVLWQRMSGALHEHFGARFDEAAIDHAFDESITWVLEVAGQAVRVERIMTKAWAN